MIEYTPTITHAVPPQFLYGIADLGEAQPTYYEAYTPNPLAAKEPKELLEMLWVVCNVDAPEDLPGHLAGLAEDTRQYRALGNRSLSVGDVVILTPVQGGHASAWICAPVGWERMARVPEPVPTPSGATWSAARSAHDALRRG